MSERNIKSYAVRIPVPFGEIAGTWYGPKDVRPILLIHGYGDNSGTFDRLIPLLPTHCSYLAIDLPGYGFSSRLPNGIMYHLTDTIFVILWIMKAYKWSKVSLIGHSLGAIMCFIFAGSHSDKIDLFIALDALQPSYPGDILEQHDHLHQHFMKSDEMNINNVPPHEYTYEALVEKIKDIPAAEIPEELCHHLLRRNIRESNIRPGKYYWGRDNRTKFPLFLEWSKETNNLTAQKAFFPTLIIKASDSVYYGDEDELTRLANVMKGNNAHTRVVPVKGTHYVHLIEPENVAVVIEQFLDDCGYFAKATESKL